MRRLLATALTSVLLAAGCLAWWIETTERAWQRHVAVRRDQVLDALCAFAAETLSWRDRQDRARALEYQEPLSKQRDRDWRDFVRRARERRGAEGK